MKKTLSRILILVLALALLMAAVPGALAVESKPNASRPKFDRAKLVIYVGECYELESYLDDEGAGDITWKSSNKKIASVASSSGDLLGKKPGTVTITATDCAGRKGTIKVEVRKNKLDNICGSKPSVSIAPSRGAKLRLKSMEIVTPTKVVCEFYLAFNFPSSYKATKIKSLNARIEAYDKYYEMTANIVNGKAKSPIGISVRGKQVKVFKAVFTGLSVCHTGIVLKKTDRSSFGYSVSYKLGYKH